MKRLAIIIIALLLLPVGAWAMTDNGDGTRSFFIGSGKDFATLADVVWGHPAGVMPGDRLNGAVVKFDSSTGKHGAKKNRIVPEIFFGKSYKEE
jgi:hypothetical protein